MEAINIDTLDQISLSKNNFKLAGRCNLGDVCKIGYGHDIDFYTTCMPRMTTIVTYYNNPTSLPRASGGELKEPLYCIARR